MNQEQIAKIVAQLRKEAKVYLEKFNKAPNESLNETLYDALETTFTKLADIFETLRTE